MVKAWLIELDKESLIALSVNVRVQITRDGGVPARTKTEINQRVIPAAEILRSSPDTDKRSEARAQLIAFCREHLMRNHTGRPQAQELQAEDQAELPGPPKQLSES